VKPIELIYFEQIRDVLYQLYKSQDITIYEFYNTLIETRKLLNLFYVDITGDFNV